MHRWKVTRENQDGWRKDQKELEILKSVTNFNFHPFTQHIFLNECENVIKNVIIITITQANL